jgi:transcriptional regulator with XRE-family HTH domain
MRAVSRSPSHVSQDRRSYRACAPEIAALIRRVREERGLTQAELAERMGSTQSIVARWERGDHDFKAQTLARLAAALQVEIVVHFGPMEVSG